MSWSEGESLEDLVFEGETAGEDERRNVLPLLAQALRVLKDGRRLLLLLSMLDQLMWSRTLLAPPSATRPK